ncbi:transporter [Actinomyces sp. zg-332]|uniref:aspartate:alanine exchanger family transporter n=1 Tax=Actinomyces sp. zg-332 TaxID=2708340 RepID=UPI001423FE00|nr:TrkA C-terminal domain-containing protein [Actinomyces sp. zg-332]QPK94368.1 transporter [Actinomyces sp. zg-332]
MRTILDFFAQNTVLLLFVLILIGMAIGKVKIGGISLGVAAVLFVSMGYSAFSHYYGIEVSIPAEFGTLGLVLFTFTIGMSSGPSFFKILRKSFWHILGLLLILIFSAAACYFVGYYLLGMSPAVIGGTYAGALTSTPTLSAVGNASNSLQEATVGYALAYIYGILGMMIFCYMALRYRRKDKDAPEKIYTHTVRVESDLNLTIGQISKKYGSKIKFPRLAHGENGHVSLPSEDQLLREGDLVTIVGSEKVVKEVIDFLGHESSFALDADRSEMDMCRFTISNPKFSGCKVKDLNVEGRFNATVSRVRRGDVDMFADPDLRLQQGDRVRVVVPWNKIKELNEYFGDSVKGLIDINPVALGLGIVFGVLVGMIPLFPLPGGHFSLGIASATMLVGIIFGYLGKIGSVPLAIPYTACQVLCELGLCIFLVQAGVNGGSQILNAFTSDMWWKILLLGIMVTSIVGGFSYLVMRHVMKMGGTRLSGFIAGAQTQSVLLSFSSNITKGDPRVAIGYAMVYPIATICKVFIGQILGGL